jgi:hypothetical protein
MDLSMRSRLSCDYVVRRKTFAIAPESQHDWLYLTLLANQVGERYEVLVRTPADPDDEVASVGEMPDCPSAGRTLWGRVAADPITLVYGPEEKSTESEPIVAEASDSPERSWERAASEPKVEIAPVEPTSVDTTVEEEDPEPERPLTVEPPTFEPPPRQKRRTTLAKHRPGLAVEWDVYDAGEEFKARFQATADFGPYAKVMMVPASAPHGDETETTPFGTAEKYMNQKTEGELTFNAPHDPGTYELRMYDRDGGDEVAAVAFDVWAPEPGLYLNRDTFFTGDKIPFAFRALGSFGEYASVLLMPVSAPHGDENEAYRSAKEYCYLNKRTEGNDVFIGPNETGQYALRMYDRDGGKEVATATVTIVDYSLPIARWKEVIGFDPVAFVDQLVSTAETHPMIRDEDLAASFSVIPVLTRPEDLAPQGPGPRYAVNAAPRVSHSVLGEHQSFQMPFFAAESTDPNELFDAMMKKHRRVKASFGHDVDLEGAVFKFAETFAGNLNLTGKMKLIQAQIKNGREFFKNVSAEMASSDNPAIVDDLMVFGIKAVLDSMSPEELQNLEVTIRGTKVKGKELVPWAEKLSAAGGEASEGAYMEALQTASIGAVDILCPACATARAGLVAAHEAAKAVQAWVEDDMTQLHFEHYLKDTGASMTVSGYRQVKDSARRALAKLHEAAGRPSPTHEEVESFIWRKFGEWKKEKEKREQEVETTLLLAKDYYLDLKSSEDGYLLNRLGKTERARVERYCELVLQIRGDLLRYGGKDPLVKLLGGNKILNSRVFFLVKQYLEYDHNDYGVAFANSLRSLGWIEPVAKLDKSEQASAKEKIHARLRKLGGRKLDALFAYLGIDTNFLGCLCRHYAGSGASVYFDVKPVSGSEACRDAGRGNCVLDGFGCTRAPLPEEDHVWESCSSSYGGDDGSIENFILRKVLDHRIERRRP